MLPKSPTLYIYSVIPRLYEELVKRLPNTSIKSIPVKGDLLQNNGKVVNDDDVSQLKDAEILMSDAELIIEIHDKLPNIKWIQCTWAGVEGLVKNIKNGIVPSYPITRFACQGFSQLINEYVFTWIVNCERRNLEIYQKQLRKEWYRVGGIYSYRSLQDLTVGVLGVGQFGSEVIKGLNYFQSKVYTLSRSGQPPEGVKVANSWSVSGLAAFLEDVDYIVNTLPSTPETKNLLGGEILKYAKNAPVLINVGRGTIITEEEILKALERGWISKVVLDVFEEEPLPAQSPLWLHPDVYITPHVAAVSRPSDLSTSFVDNLERYLAGKPLLNVIDWDRGY